MESSIKTGFFNKKKKMNSISCVDPKTYSERFIRYINNLTDFKTLLSDEIKEEKNEENSSELDSDDDSEDESFFKRQRKKGILSLVNKKIQNSLLLPVEGQIESKSCVEKTNKIINLNKSN